MNAFRDIDALLRVIAREKELLRFLFTGRKAPSLRWEQAVENFCASDERRLRLLQDHGVIRLVQGILMLEDTYLRFFEEVLEVNEQINVQSVRQHINTLTSNIELWMTAGTEKAKGRYMGEVAHILRGIGMATERNVIDLKRNIESTYKNERDYAVKRKRLEQLDAQRADIALLVKEAERIMDGIDTQLRETVDIVKASLTESYHSLLELDRQIIRYLHKIEAQHRLCEKIRHIKYLKDQLVWEQQTDILFLLQTHRSCFLEKRPRYLCPPSLERITSSPEGIAALEDAHSALRHPRGPRKTVGEPLRPQDLSPAPAVRDLLNTQEIKSAFIGSSQDLMSFITRYPFQEPASEEGLLTLFCRIASEFADELRISDQYSETPTHTYPLIYPK